VFTLAQNMPLLEHLPAFAALFYIPNYMKGYAIINSPPQKVIESPLVDCHIENIQKGLEKIY